MPTDTARRGAAQGRQLVAAALTAAPVIAGVLAAALASRSTSQALSLLGLPDPGLLTTLGIPALTAAGEVCAAIAVGSLLLSAFVLPPQRTGVLDLDGYLAARTAAAAMSAWAVCAALLVPLTLSDASGRPISEVAAQPALFAAAVADVDTAAAWAATAVLAAVVAVICRSALTHAVMPALFAGAVLTLMPRAVSGHSSTGGDHDIATDSLILHIVAAAVWIGGLLALLAHAGRRGDDVARATQRYSRFATVAFAVIAVSGVVNAAVRVPVTALWGSTYGILVLGKAAALIALGVFGWRQRRHLIGALSRPSDTVERRRAFLRLSVVETFVLLATVALAVALGRTPPPAPEDEGLPQAHEEVLGFALDGPLTVARAVFDWRIDLLFGSAAVLAVVIYLLAVRRRRRLGLHWRRRWTASWIAGAAVMLLATSSGVGLYAPAVFSAHIASIVATTILASMLLVLGRPITLVASVTPTAAPQDGALGWRHFLRSVFHGRIARFASSPWVSATVLLVSLFVIYRGGLFDAAADSHVAGIIVRAWLLVWGLAFFWSTIGLDPVPRRVGGPTRLLATFLLLGGFASFVVALIDTDTAVAAAYYENLRLEWNTDLLADQRRAGNLAWALGELPLLLAAVLAAVRWSASDRRTDDDAEDRELLAYNEMLGALPTNGGHGRAETDGRGRRGTAAAGAPEDD